MSEARVKPGRRLLVLGLIAAAVAVGLFVFRADVAALAEFLRRASFDARIGRFAPDETLRFDRPDGVSLAASLYLAGGSEPGPTVLLLHGNTPVGRRHPLYRVLAAKLARGGATVFALDFAGFGESGDPFELDSIEALDANLDVDAALAHLDDTGRIGGRGLYVVCHSGGCASGLSVGIRDARIAGIAAIGPPRRSLERLQREREREFFFGRARRNHHRIYGKEFPDWYTPEVWHEQALAGGTSPSLMADMGLYLEYFSGPAHKPLLLIDGELESVKDRAYLRDYYESVSPPKDYLTLEGADHYCNTRPASGLALYDASAIGAVVGKLQAWIDSTGTLDP